MNPRSNDLRLLLEKNLRGSRSAVMIILLSAIPTTAIVLILGILFGPVVASLGLLLPIALWIQDVWARWNDSEGSLVVKLTYVFAYSESLSELNDVEEYYWVKLIADNIPHNKSILSFFHGLLVVDKYLALRNISKFIHALIVAGEENVKEQLVSLIEGLQLDSRRAITESFGEICAELVSVGERLDRSVVIRHSGRVNIDTPFKFFLSTLAKSAHFELQTNYVERQPSIYITGVCEYAISKAEIEGYEIIVRSDDAQEEIRERFILENLPENEMLIAYSFVHENPWIDKKEVAELTDRNAQPPRSLRVRTIRLKGPE